jgi:membrane associated rhomboid family serine protease
MLIIPLGNENTTVRRHPWVTYSLLALNVVICLLTTLGGPGPQARKQFNSKMNEIGEIIDERPYLSLPPDLSPYCDEECTERLGERREQFVRSGRVPVDFVLRTQQQQLDDLVGEAMKIRARSPNVRYGYYPARPLEASILTYMFLHAGWLHLFGNMLFLFVSAPFIEDLFGRVLFVLLYLVTGVASALTHASFFPDSVVPLVGASGAVAGVMGAFLVRLATARLRFLVFPIAFLPLLQMRITLPAFVVLPLWVGEQLLYAHLAEAGSSVAFWAHVGGFASGVVLAGLIGMSGLESRYIHPRIEKSISLEQHPGLERALGARMAGRWDEARRHVSRVLATDPANLDALRLQYDIEVDAGRLPEAGQHAARLLEVYVRRNEHELATDLVNDVCRSDGEGIPARFYLTAGGLLERADDVTLALHVYQTAVARHPADPAAFRALFRQGEILKRIGETADARRAFTNAARHPACQDGLRQAVEKSLGELARS